MRKAFKTLKKGNILHNSPRTLTLNAIYSAGSLLNFACQILIVPALASFENSILIVFSKCFLVIQIFVIVSNYAFSITLPRLANLHPRIAKSIFPLILAFQLLLAISALAACLIFVPKGNSYTLTSTVACAVCFGPVFSWNWHHILHRNICAGVVNCFTKGVLIAFLFAQSFGIFSIPELYQIAAIIIAAFLIPALPTVIKVMPNAPGSFSRRRSWKIVALEFFNNWPLFQASLASSSISIVGSLIIATKSPDLLPSLQQFERIRASISGISVMIINNAYVSLLTSGKNNFLKINSRPNNFYFILITIVITLLGFFLFQIPIPEAILEKFRLSKFLIFAAFFASFVAVSSNIFAFFHVFPNKFDKFYSRTILQSAIIFMLLSIFALTFIPDNLLQAICCNIILCEIYIIHNLIKSASNRKNDLFIS